MVIEGKSLRGSRLQVRAGSDEGQIGSLNFTSQFRILTPAEHNPDFSSSDPNSSIY